MRPHFFIFLVDLEEMKKWDLGRFKYSTMEDLGFFWVVELFFKKFLNFENFVECYGLL